MKLPSGPVFEHAQLGSTQNEIKRLLKEGEAVGIVRTDEQTSGRGRFDRVWVSGPGNSLTVSLCFEAYFNHPKPHLIGMAVAIAAARAFDVSLQWPNDLVVDNRKVGGILTEMVAFDEVTLPVVGIGVNLTQEEFPSGIVHRATSLLLEGNSGWTAKSALDALLLSISQLPEPESWDTLSPAWMERDKTPGKMYRSKVDGVDETCLLIARGIGENGSLQAEHEGKAVTIYAADALFGF